MKLFRKRPISSERLEKIRILAFDMDGTLLDGHGKLSDGNRAALDRAVEKGYRVVIASGRVYSAFPEDVLSYGDIQYAISSNGARLRDVHSGEVLHENLLTRENVDSVMPWLRDEAVMKEIFFDDTVYAGKRCLEDLARFGVVRESSRKYTLSTRRPADDIFEIIEENKGRLENINLLFADAKKRLRYLAEIKAMGGVKAVSSMPYNIEIGGANTSKASALGELAASLGLTRENIMAFGDSTNDEEMLLCSGVGVAMGNAVPELLEAADHIALPHDEDGVAEALKALLGV